MGHRSYDMATNRLSPVSFTQVQINDAFWAPRIAANRTNTLPVEYDQLKATGRLDSLKLEWEHGQPNQPHIFWESDIAKWLEAASYSLSSHPDPRLNAMVDAAIDLLEFAQRPDGYLNVYYTVVKPDDRWTNLKDNHELYCAGHLIEAGVAHAKATGSDRLLNIVRRYTDYIGSVFGPEPGQKRGYCGHEEIELALVKLYRHTNNAKYLALSKYFVDERGQQPHYYDAELIARGETPSQDPKRYDYHQASVPVRELSEVAGHAVRAMYLYTAMADLAAEYGDTGLLAACEQLWEHLCLRNMYITGGIGSSRHNEGFTRDYDLPNETAYAETCAAIGLVYWNQRMLHIASDGKYGDIVERALYNGVISGVSLDGKKFFYENPLASSGTHHRQDWFGCACCPPNLARILASFGEYVYSHGDEGFAVNLYVASTASVVTSGMSIGVSQETNYPWDGTVKLAITPETPAEFELRLRIPAWCRKHSITVNGSATTFVVDKGYAVIRRTWSEGDIVALDLDMPVELVSAHPAVIADQGRVAIQRGPVVYCVEDADHDVAVSCLAIPAGAKLTSRFDAGLLGGVAVIEGDAFAFSDAPWADELYDETAAPTASATRLLAVPYATWDNREPGAMAVWLPKA